MVPTFGWSSTIALQCVRNGLCHLHRPAFSDPLGASDFPVYWLQTNIVLRTSHPALYYAADPIPPASHQFWQLNFRRYRSQHFRPWLRWESYLIDWRTQSSGLAFYPVSLYSGCGAILLAEQRQKARSRESRGPRKEQQGEKAHVRSYGWEVLGRTLLKRVSLIWIVLGSCSYYLVVW